MIATDFIKRLLCQAFPNGDISIPVHGEWSYLADSNGEVIGHIDWKSPTFYLHDTYDLKDKAETVLQANDIDFKLVDGKTCQQPLDLRSELYTGQSDSSSGES